MATYADSKSSDKQLVLKQLLVKRSSVKGQITKFRSYLDRLIHRNDLLQLELAELTLKLGKFERLATNYDELQNEIEVLDCDNLTSQIDERDNIEQDIISSIAVAKELIDKFNYANNESRRESISQTVQCSPNHQTPNFKLPQIEIAKFSGSYFRWLEFRDTFTSLVHQNSHINEIHKFHYLTSYLEGDAARVIANLEVSSNNYKEAWKLLCDRYDNTRLLVNHHLNSLFNLQTINRESEKSLRYLVDHVTKNLRALDSLGQPTAHWDTLIIFMLSSKLDSRTLMKWEELRNDYDTLPTLNQFYKFLTDRADVLEAINRNKSESSNQPKTTPSSFRPITNIQRNNSRNEFKTYSNFTEQSQTNRNTICKFPCIVCNENHRIYDCSIFKSKSIPERSAFVTSKKLCANCLRSNHITSQCQMGPCRICKKRHNTLLHMDSVSVNAVETDTADTGESIINLYEHNNNQVLLSTALINVSNPATNQVERVRALLDSGSQSSIISYSLQKRLSLSLNPINQLNIIGIGNSCVNKVNSRCTINLSSLDGDFSATLSCLVLTEVTGKLPKHPINLKQLKLPSNIQLADPTFGQPAPVDILIGADLFWDVLGNQEKSLGHGNPKLRYSKFGWLIGGPITTITKSNNTMQCNFALQEPINNSNISDELTKFWDLENIPHKTILSESERACESHFIQNSIRLQSGRFQVKLPLQESPDCLGDSFDLAKKRFLSLEKRFRKNPTMKTQYSEFINEYAILGHLSSSPILKPDLSYFLCHHAVFKDSESTKIRVVFDGSAPTTSGFSLNDILMVGPNIQDSIFSILVRARQYKYVLTGDIEKMYRQVEVHDNDRNLQLILWRDNEYQPLQSLRLNTLTYGTASASYLSTKCIWQVGEQCTDESIKTIIQKDFYVDDLITGSNDANQLRYIQQRISSALDAACFKLRKFKTNFPNLFDDSKIDTSESLTLSESTSTLGLGWSPTNDMLHFPIKNELQSNITKRIIMSSAFKVFDPLGLLSPCVIVPKMLLQRLWQLKLGWDEPVPKEIEHTWHEFAKNLPILSQLQIPRLVLCDCPKLIELHSFSDASQKAFGACIYMRSIDCNDKVTVKLLCAKSKVAPIKPVTIPRLELCSALLAARLCKSVTDTLRYAPTRLVHWCDSSVTLGWINSDPSKLKVFVANRVTEVLDLTKASCWRHVPTKDNPADLISRGAYAYQIKDSNLWWHGPHFLKDVEANWPILKPYDHSILPEVKINSSVIEEPCINFEKYSNFNKLQRIFAYVNRFINNSRQCNSKRTGLLTIDELNESFTCLCYLSQRQSFPTECSQLSKQLPLKPKSRILSLSPYMDDFNLIRVGGRIDSSQYPYDKRHPILLDSAHHLTKLIFQKEHLRNMHAAPQLLLATLREYIWPINGRRLAKRVFNNCVRCRRIQGKTLCPKMGDLPPQRVTPDYPFISVGIDFAGHFYIVNRKGRGAKLIKCYLCLFVCLRYKCLHLEAVSDLTKEAFIMTLQRFIARRGKPAEIFCDNGRNFVAAAKDIGTFLKSNVQSLSSFGNEEKIRFIWSPTYAPHFGGIWEAGVKSAKSLIKRVMGNSHLTFEEISTLFTQVESILNSRPLYSLSSNPNDYLPLSPGHFLIGRTLTSTPATDINTNKTQLQRYERLEQIRQHFWQRWQKEYITELQQRTKWKSNSKGLQVGDLVLIHEEHVPPLSWRLGRVARLFPGPDGISRVADINTLRGCIRRPLVRLCPLPKADEEH